MASDYALSLPRASDSADPSRARHAFYAEGVPSDPRPFGVLHLDGPQGETVSIHVQRPQDLNALIWSAQQLRTLLAEAETLELVEAAARQMKCDNCNAVGTEENPLVPVESSAAHPEGYVHGAGCPDAGPHHEDAHADSAPLG